MARLALTVAGAVAGAAIAYFSMGVATAAGIELGMSIGSLAGSIIGSLAFPGKGQHVYGPRINDMQVSTSAPGQVIPLVFGTMRLGGQIIWSTGLIETTTNVKQGGKGGPSVTQTTYTYTVSVAAAFCQGPATITRLWGDTKLIYDSTGSSSSNRGNWNATTNYNVGDIVFADQDSATAFICLVANVGNPLANANFWQQDIAATNVNTSKYTPPVLYSGSETQLPSPLISQHEGASVTPAYRGTCYAVWDNLPLADFGNRLPNLRAEVTSNGENAYPMDLTPWGQDAFKPQGVVTDPLGQTAYVFAPSSGGGTDFAHAYIQRIDLSTNKVVASGIIDMSPLAGYDSATDLVAGYNAIMTVDAAGNLWGVGSVAGNPGLVKIDQWTFKAIAFCDLTASGVMNHSIPYAISTFIKEDGTSYIIGFAAQGAEGAGNGSVMFAVSVDGVPSGRDPSGLPTYSTLPGTLWGQYYNFTAPVPDVESTPTVNWYQIYPVSDPAGNTYFIFGLTHSTGATGDWYIAKVPLFSGNNVFPTPGPVLMGFELFSYPADSTIGVGQAMFWNPSDSTLVVLTNAGAFLKIDPNNNGAIISQVGSSSEPQFNIASGDVIAGGFLSMNAHSGNGNAVQAAFKGQAQNGTIWAPAIGSSKALVFETGTFTLVAEYDFSLYADKPQEGAGTWPYMGLQYTGNAYIYDAVGNSLLATSQLPAPIGFSSTYAFYRAFVDRINTKGVTAASIVRTICNLATIPDENVDASQLVGISVEGYPVTSLSTGRDMISSLGQTFFFEARESDFQIQFITRGQPSLLTLDEDELGMLADNAELMESIGQEQDVPKNVEVIYIDPLQDYQQGQQKKVRHSKTKKTFNQTSISVPFVMSSQQAAQLADKIMWTAETERRTYKMNLWKALYMLLDPCDVITFDYHAAQLQARIADDTLGQNFAVALGLTSDDTNSYASVALGTSGSGFKGQTILGLAISLLWIFDIPYLQDQDADAAGNIGYYFGMAPSAPGANWPAGVLYKSSDNAAYAQVDASVLPMTYGTAQEALPVPPLGVDTWDNTSTLTVRMNLGAEPTSDTMLNVLNGSNAALLYPSLELIQFTTVVQNADGSVTLSGLLRGRRGTDTFVGAHTYGETVFFLLSGGTVHEQVSQSQLGQLQYYKPITVGADLNSNKISQQIILKGRDLMPYSVAAFKRAVSGSDILFSWVRRTRLGGSWQDGFGQVPLSENNETYSMDILDGTGTVKRTFASITPPGGVPDSWTSPAQPHQLYTAAQQTTDGYLSGHGWTVNVYQVSAQVGRGFVATVALP